MIDRVLQLNIDLNKLKRGLADLEIDCDSAIQALQVFEFKDLSFIETGAIVYNLLLLCQHEEYSMREYALVSLQKALDWLTQLDDNLQIGFLV